MVRTKMNLEEVEVCGIPAQARIVSYTPGRAGYLTGPVDKCYPADPAELEYELYDRKGYRAGWLESKIAGTTEEEDLISRLHEIVENRGEYMREMREAAREDCECRHG